MLEWLDALPLSVWLRESPSIWSYPTVLTLHTMGLAVLVGSCAVLDLRLLGVSRNIPLSAFRWVSTAVVIGLTVNLITGGLLFIKDPLTWTKSIPFLVKMSLVVASVATVVPMRRYVSGGEAGGRARILAVVSLVAWSAAVTAGRLLAYL
jgi:hypothetical protein